MATTQFCFALIVLFSLQLSVCLWWHDYRRDGFPTHACHRFNAAAWGLKRDEVGAYAWRDRPHAPGDLGTAHNKKWAKLTPP